MFKGLPNFLRKRLSSVNLYIAKLGVAGTINFLLQKVTKPKGSLIHIRLKNGGRFYLRSKTYDVHIFSQIFIYEELNFNLPVVPQAIVDCGANIGLATLYFKFKYPHARIISVEPEDSNFEMLKRNTEPYTNIHLEKKGLWNKSCTLYVVDEGEGAASYKVFEVKPAKNVIGEVDAISVDDIMRKYQCSVVDLLKMDIEGSEFALFKNATTPWAAQINCLAVEIHEHMNPGCKKLIDGSLKQFRYNQQGEYHIYTKPVMS